MRCNLTPILSVLASLAWLGTTGSQAGTYKHITIDGSFDDWAGVPIAYTDAEDATGSFDLKDVYIANDENFLYVRATLYAPADYGIFHHHVVIDSDNNAATGSSWLGIGSELMIEDGAGYQQKNGGFNEGDASGPKTPLRFRWKRSTATGPPWTPPPPSPTNLRLSRPSPPAAGHSSI